VVSFTFDEHATTLMGATPQVVAATFAAMGADAVGVNCSQGPAALAALAARMKPLVDVPVLVQANAGLPHGEAGQATYDINASVYAAGVREILSAGATLVGGCCGTDPSYVQAFAPLVVAAPCGAAKESGEVEAVAAASAEKGGEVEAVAAASAEKPGEVDGAPAAFPARAVTGAPARDLVLTSPRQVVAAGPVAGPCVIGERLNPTGRKDLAAALVAGQFDAYIQEAQAQVAAGARVLDVNVGVPGLNEEAVLPQVVELLSTVVDAALCIDTGNAAALEVALKVYPGVALINSVNAKASSLAQVLPLAARYGACVLGLTLDEAGIPATASARQELAARMVTAAEGAGIARSRVAIDPLCMTVATNPAGVSDLLATIAWCRRELGVCTALGASNVSFGLPARPALNATFVAAALAAGLTLPIANVLDPALATTVAASRALLGYDQGFAGWIAFAQDHALEAPAAAQLAQGAQSAQPAQSAAGASNPAGFSAENASASGPASAAAATTPRERLYAGVLAGRKAEVDAAARELLDAGTPPLDLINAALIPALDEVGVRFQAGTLFLPQLLASAEAAQAGFAQVEKALPPQAATRPAVVVATVKGDVHDIGKNIVAMLLKNYGFDVVDLGKDVPAERIVEATRASGARLVGLSALMTTTLPAMEAAVAAVHAALPGVAVMVGGAVVTPEYAASISADFYAQDATESARIAQKVAGSK
jgi:5-methyltetrahydrofolate--homocysteine methyltransferase